MNVILTHFAISYEVRTCCKSVCTSNGQKLEAEKAWEQDSSKQLSMIRYSYKGTICKVETCKIKRKLWYLVYHVKLLSRKRELTLELHFSAVRSSAVNLRFHSITDYLRGLFLHVRVSDYWWCHSHLLSCHRHNNGLRMNAGMLLAFP